MIKVDETPSAQNACRISDSLWKPVEDETERLPEAGMIRESSSKYAAPMVPVSKLSGEMRAARLTGNAKEC